jgi:hypothetical protein
MPSGDITVPGVVLGLVGGVGGTLLKQLFDTRRRKVSEPKLGLEPVKGLGMATVDQRPAAYARLEVTNHPKSEGATGVMVRIEKVEGGAPENMDFLGDWQLAWANEDRGEPNVPPTPRTVGPDGRRGVDLAHLNPVAPGLAIVDVRPQPPKGTWLNRLGTGTYVFRLAVHADNAPPRRYAVELVHDGVPWDGEHMSATERLRVASVRRL